MYYEHAKLVIKHTFIEFQCLDDDSPKLRRNKSDPSLVCAALVECGPGPTKCIEVPTPTTCASVKSDDDDASSLSSPLLADEEDDVSTPDKWSFISTFNRFPDMPQVALQDDTGSCHAAMVWPESCDTLPVLSTSPLMRPANITYHSGTGTEVQQSSSYGMQTDDALDCRTTLMVRNLPVDLSQPALVQQFKEVGYGGLFDFVYMPMNLRGQGNFGYAFINFTSHAVAAHVMMQMQPLEHEDSSNSERWTSMWSTCQGWGANVERYRNSPLMHELVPIECKPAVYDCSGNQVSFPRPTKSIPKPRIHWPGPKNVKSCEDQDGQLGAGSCGASHSRQSKKCQRQQPVKQATGVTFQSRASFR